MNLPTSFFDPGTFKLTGRAKNSLKEFIKTQELSQFNDLIGYTPNPENPCPPPRWPWPRRNLFDLQFKNNGLAGPPWPEPCFACGSFNNSNLTYPNPEDINPFPWPWPIGPLVKDLMHERMLELVIKSPLKENTYNFIDVIKRENIIIEAMSELQENLSDVKSAISMKLKKMH